MRLREIVTGALGQVQEVSGFRGCRSGCMSACTRRRGPILNPTTTIDQGCFGPCIQGCNKKFPSAPVRPSTSFTPRAVPTFTTSLYGCK